MKSAKVCAVFVVTVFVALTTFLVIKNILNVGIIGKNIQTIPFQNQLKTTGLNSDVPSLASEDDKCKSYFHKIRNRKIFVKTKSKSKSKSLKVSYASYTRN